MTTMSPYYASESEVGPVFDVANYSRAKAIKMAVISMIFAGVTGLGAVYVWNPDWINPNPSEIWADAHQETKNLKLQYPTGVKVGVGIAGSLAALFFLMSLSCVANASSGDYHIRAGEGGISLKVPDGVFGTLEKDIAWEDITKLTVVQEKYLGSMSRNAGNIGGELQIRARDGFARDIRLDDFRQDAWLIHQRIQEARETRPAELVPA